MPAVARDLARLAVQRAGVDGEVVVLDKRGRPRFRLLQNALGEGGGASLHLFAFDLPYVDGLDLRQEAVVGGFTEPRGGRSQFGAR